MSTITLDHPKQKLMFYVAQDIDTEIRNTIRKLINELAESRSWVIAPPTIIDVIDEPDSKGEDLTIATLGGELELYSALPPSILPREIDIKHLEEVTELVNTVAKISKESNIIFEFELNGVFVGEIEDGVISKTLQAGLLDEWKKQLGI